VRSFAITGEEKVTLAKMQILLLERGNRWRTAFVPRMSSFHGWICIHRANYKALGSKALSRIAENGVPAICDERNNCVAKRSLAGAPILSVCPYNGMSNLNL
jgi:hypothetical protein